MKRRKTQTKIQPHVVARVDYIVVRARNEREAVEIAARAPPILWNEAGGTFAMPLDEKDDPADKVLSSFNEY